MFKRTVSGMMLILLLIGTLTLTSNIISARAEPTTIIVPDDYPTIQEAIDNANDLDKVYVRAGTYYENLFISSKKVSLVGEGWQRTIIDGNNSVNPVIEIVAESYANVTGFTIRNGRYHGIYYGAHNQNLPSPKQIASITGNTIMNCQIGLWVNDTRFFLIYHNNFINNSRLDIYNEEGTFFTSYNGTCEGNFWSSHNGTDSNTDGIGDYPYNFSGPNSYPLQITDYCPLMVPYIEGDVNHDGIVNMRDIGLCCNAFGSVPGSPNWNPHYDINEDTMIDMRDIGIACNNFMKRWE